MIIEDRFITETGVHQVVHKFDNGFGASVVNGPYTYGGAEGLYDLAVLKFNDIGDYHITYETEITDDVVGWLPEKKVDEILKQIEALKETA